MCVKLMTMALIKIGLGQLTGEALLLDIANCIFRLGDGLANLRFDDNYYASRAVVVV